MLSITKNCETLFIQTQTEPQETLKIRSTQSGETFSFKPFTNLGLEAEWMIGLTSLEVYKSVFNITEENNKFELYIYLVDDVFSNTQLKNNVAEILGHSDISSEYLQHDIHGPKFFVETYRKLAAEKSQTVDYYLILMGYAHSPFRHFEGYLSFFVGLVGKKIQLFSEKNNSNFVTLTIPPGVYSKKDFSEVPSTGFQNEFEISGRNRPKVKCDKPDSNILEWDSITMRTKLFVKKDNLAMRFNRKSFPFSRLGLSPHWDFKRHDNYSGGKYINLYTIDKVKKSAMSLMERY